MSLFDLQDVCIAIGSIATLDLPMVVDLIGIYGLKGPYCTLTTTDWFLQALSVIHRASWGDVARRFTMIRWAAVAFAYTHIVRPELSAVQMLIGIGPAVSRCAWSSHRNWLSVESNDSSDESESGSVGLLSLRRFVSYPFRMQRRSWKRIAETSPFSSLDRNKSDHAKNRAMAAAGGGVRRVWERRRLCELGDIASRGPTTIAAPKSQFWTCPTDHGKAPSNIAP
ncbi:hypothetical protein F511_08674 [Dorcoceras hygrometricum]|uniref:Acyl-CoA dehydrogenase-related protein n=1 Tax=Dorcoceras hygrometricum TaxID=472368 RepID=A0A2Z7AS45_9LAMI|nr:hypothetical protein F511_08674 [Dorcoceras hygrometricum]